MLNTGIDTNTDTSTVVRIVRCVPTSRRALSWAPGSRVELLRNLLERYTATLLQRLFSGFHVAW